MNCTNTDFDFSTALIAVKEGHRIARAGWNGKDQWVSMTAGVLGLKAEKFWNKHNKNFAEQNGGRANVVPILTLKNAQDSIVMGWTPSSGDLFAQDWIVLEDETDEDENDDNCDGDCDNCRLDALEEELYRNMSATPELRQFYLNELEKENFKKSKIPNISFVKISGNDMPKELQNKITESLRKAFES